MEQEELIQKYIQGTLSTAEQTQFDTLLKDDLDFAQKVTEHKNLHSAIKATEKDDLKTHLEQLEATQNESDTSKKPFNKNIRLAIAVVLLLFFGLIGNYIIQQANMNETLYATYFEPYPNALAPVTRGQDAPRDLLVDAMRFYEDRNYEKAAKLLDRALATMDILTTEILFYKAMCLVNLKKEKEALGILRQIKHKKTRYTSQIYWYGALIHIKFDENEKALKALEYMDAIKTQYKLKQRTVLKNKLR